MHLPTKAAQPECHEHFIDHLSEWPCPHSLSAATTTKSTLSGAQLVTTKAVWLAEMWWAPLCMSDSPPAWPCILALLCSCHSLMDWKAEGSKPWWGLPGSSWWCLCQVIPCSAHYLGIGWSCIPWVWKSKSSAHTVDRLRPYPSVTNRMEINV